MTMLLVDFPDEYNANVQKIINQEFGVAQLPYQSYFNIDLDPRYSIPVAAYSDFGQMQQWNDGATIPTDNANRRYAYTLTMVNYGLSFKVSRNHVRYGMVSQVNRWAQALGRSGAATLETVHANILNNAFASGTYGDGVYLCASNHPISGTTQSNTLGAVALSTTSVDTMTQNALLLLDYKGKPAPVVLTKIIVPAQLARKATQIIDSPQEYGTTDNQINYYKGKLRVVADYNLTSSTAWFGQAENHGLVSKVGQAFNTDSYIEDNTQSLVHFAALDFVCGAEDWYGFYGSSGA